MMESSLICLESEAIIRDNNYKTKKILKFDNNIKIKSYQYYSFPIGIIAANTNFYENILINKFNNIFIGASFQYYESEYFDWEIFNVKKIEVNKKKIIIEIIKYICMDFYININVNEFFIKSRYAYKNIDNIHDCLIIGYDLENEIFIIVGNDENGMLSKTSINFEEFYKSVNFQGEYINLIAINLKEDFIENINKEKLIEGLIQYCLGDKPTNELGIRDYNNLKFGINAYKEFLKNIQDYNECSEFLINDIY
ncbi:hypothetical protein G6Z17_09225, partial [Clostridium perfringens]|uniref:hypothetical protein n=1 Tax=Clostridium perfringens TaxID=1502 RepID=UPI0013E2A653